MKPKQRWDIIDTLYICFLVAMFLFAFMVKPAQADMLDYWLGYSVANDGSDAHNLVWYKLDEKIIVGVHNHQKSFECIIKAKQDVLEDMIAHYAAYGIIIKRKFDDTFVVDYHALITEDDK